MSIFKSHKSYFASRHGFLGYLIAIILQSTLYTSFVPWTDGFSLICYQSVNRLQVFLLNSLIGLIICMLVLIVILKFAPSLVVLLYSATQISLIYGLYRLKKLAS